MNTAVNFRIKSIDANKCSKHNLSGEKTYTFKLFCKGKIVIAGLQNSYQ
jgi:hypothetical protein